MGFNEQDLVTSCREGDLKAFEKLVIIYQKRLYGFACGKIGNQADAEEVVQETLLKCFVNLKFLRDTARFGSWLFSICRNGINHFLRSKGRAPEIQLPEPDALSGESRESPWKEYRSLVKSAIAKLSPEQKEVLQLRYYCSLSYKEIAAVCSLPVNRVKSRLYEAKNLLKEKLPNMSEFQTIPQERLISQKEILMQKLELIKNGAYVIKALSLENQIRLCGLAKEDAKFDPPLLDAFSRIKGGKEFVQGYNARMSIRDLSWILNYSRDLDEWIIGNLEQTAPDLAEAFKSQMFVFDDMILLDPEVVHTVLKEITPETLFTATLSCSRQLKHYLLSFFSEEQQKALLLKVPELDTEIKTIDAAQYDVVRVIHKLNEAGRIRVELPEDPEGTVRLYLQK